MQALRILVIGGYGFFGRRLIERLARRDGSHIMVAGRSASRGQALVQGLRRFARSEVSSAVLDAQDHGLAERLVALRPEVVVLASGPFQEQRYEVARACIAAGAHYIDLADGRDFVAGMRALNAQAQAAGVSVISGASSVPALSSAAADHLTHGLTRVEHIDIGISPGNRTERGLSTVQAILSYCGKPLPAAAPEMTVGWSGSRPHTYPAPVGTRLLSPCDVPDLVLLPERYPGHPRLSFGAGLELRFLHRGMNAMAKLAHWGLVADWSRYAVPLKRAADLFKSFGSDAGAMHVSVEGEASDGTRRSRTWHLLATGGDGPYVPTLAAAALIHKLQAGQRLPTGAGPCLGLLTLQDFANETKGLRIEMSEASA